MKERGYNSSGLAVLHANLTSNFINFREGFSDVEKSQWFYIDVTRLAQNSIFKGYPDGSFKYDLILNRGQVAALINKVMDSGPITKSTEVITSSTPVPSPRAMEAPIAETIETILSFGSHRDSLLDPTKNTLKFSYGYYYDDCVNQGSSQVIIGGVRKTNKDFELIDRRINQMDFPKAIVIEGNTTKQYEYGYIGAGVRWNLTV